MDFETIAWSGDAYSGTLRLLDQTRLPQSREILQIRETEEFVHAIKKLAVRGAPAIGISAAYACVLAARQSEDPLQGLREAMPLLRASRPTAVNLFWALDRMERLLEEQGQGETDLPELLLKEARAIHQEDRRLCRRMAEHGAPLIRNARQLLTHCNTGALATGGIGTALGVIRQAFEQGADFEVYAGETRPLLQGARLTAWELQQLGIPFQILPDSAGPGLLLRGSIDAVLVGADRIAANGDTANKVGTLPLALAAARAGKDFFVVAPSTSFDLQLACGDEIPIEERNGAELGLHLRPEVLPKGAKAASPAFDVTPAELITAIICEHGVIEAPTTNSIKKLLASGR
ncbi:MAG: S-methyl-5-thioribose-1-phosphate isomerase [Planctomycetota bacterium]|nr:MAG: S-methyl-5-thioribose-1-phosphate isomerase [Planctomycetota bacterium]